MTSKRKTINNYLPLIYNKNHTTDDIRPDYILILCLKICKSTPKHLLKVKLIKSIYHMVSYDRLICHSYIITANPEATAVSVKQINIGVPTVLA